MYILQERFPGHDVEHAAMKALYLAALTYRPGRQGFHRWLMRKILGQTANFRRTNSRQEASGIHFREYDTMTIDRRFYYRERR
jgi:hypothetical protein